MRKHYSTDQRQTWPVMLGLEFDDVMSYAAVPKQDRVHMRLKEQVRVERHLLGWVHQKAPIKNRDMDISLEC